MYEMAFISKIIVFSALQASLDLKNSMNSKKWLILNNYQGAIWRELLPAKGGAGK
jgi:hypothetical protein